MFSFNNVEMYWNYDSQFLNAFLLKIIGKLTN